MDLIYKFNLKNYASATQPEKQTIRQGINSSLAMTGCLYIANTSIDQKSIINIQNLTNAFFLQSIEQKNKIKKPSEKIMRGYTGLASEILAKSVNAPSARDLNESFQIGPIETQGRTDRTDENMWPTFNVAFKKNWEDYYRAMENISANLLDVFSDCLNIPYDFFNKNTTQHTSRLRARFYPALTTPAEANQFRASPHTDLGAFALTLPQNGRQGLEIFNPDKKSWVPVDANDGYFTLNLGDLFARLTNDFWKAPLHRVIANGEHSTNDRLSIIYFHSFNHDTLVKSFDGFTTSSYPSRYPPVTTAEHLTNSLTKF